MSILYVLFIYNLYANIYNICFDNKEKKEHKYSKMGQNKNDFHAPDQVPQTCPDMGKLTLLCYTFTSSMLEV